MDGKSWFAEGVPALITSKLVCPGADDEAVGYAEDVHAKDLIVLWEMDDAAGFDATCFHFEPLRDKKGRE